MKFIPLGDRHLEDSAFEDYPHRTDCGKPRRTPSYFDTAKKLKSEKSSRNPNKHPPA